MTIRPAKAGDAGAIESLLSQVLEVHASLRPDIFISGTRKYSRAELLAIFSNPKRPVFVYENEKGEVVGHAFCQIEETGGASNLRDMATLYIDDICVDEKWRRHGVAKALFRHVRDFAKKLGCQRLTLNVWEGNEEARAFYAAMGLRPLKTTLEQVL